MNILNQIYQLLVEICTIERKSFDEDFRKKAVQVVYIISLLFPLHLLVYHLHHLQKLLLTEYPLLHKQPGKSFLLDYLGNKEFFKGDCFLNLINPKGRVSRTLLVGIYCIPRNALARNAAIAKGNPVKRD